MVNWIKNTHFNVVLIEKIKKLENNLIPKLLKLVSNAKLKGKIEVVYKKTFI